MVQTLLRTRTPRRLELQRKRPQTIPPRTLLPAHRRTLPLPLPPPPRPPPLPPRLPPRLRLRTSSCSVSRSASQSMTSGQSFSFSSMAPPSSSFSPSTSFSPSSSPTSFSPSSTSPSFSINGPTYTTTVTVYRCPPSGVMSASGTASGTAPGSPTGIPGPSACPVSSQSGASSTPTPTPTPDPCGSAPAPLHPRDFSLSARTPTDPASTKIKGEDIWAKILAATTDKSPALTTDKYLASYTTLFTVSEDIPADVKGQRGNEILSLFNKLTENGADLANPLFPNFPATLRKRQARTLFTYELEFAPGVIVAATSQKRRDPIPPAEQVNWNVIAMELYKEFKGEDAPTDLRFVMQFHISNDLTKTVLTELYTNSQMAAAASAINTEWVKWDANDGGCGTNAVLTLLGTDNGSGPGYILVDYHTTLGGKQIVNIYTRRQSGWWGMVIEYA
ncbi:hypothetical protein B0H10DRAFT_1986284 [Mycena sp. CBHHK59/15]|nr:hypothetical protein B0H10DRAFT_1986284 [Mycena sp. CBHHK59/15]